MRHVLPIVVVALAALFIPVPSIAEVPASLLKQLRARYGANLRAVRESTDPVLKKHLARHAVFEVNVFNPVSHIAGRPEHFFTAVVDRARGKLQVLESPAQVLAFLGEMSLQCSTEALALESTRLYAALRRVVIVGAAAELDRKCRHRRLYPAKERTIGPAAVARSSARVTVTFHALVDPFICSVNRIVLTIPSSGKPDAAEQHVSTRSGYD